MVRLDHPASLSRIPKPLALAIGVFDGVHLGHRAVLAQAHADAATWAGEAVAVTFDPHPAKILRPEAAPALLTSTEQKLNLMSGLGFAYALVIPFDRKMAGTTAEDFLELLTANRNLQEIVVGQGWRFGKGRTGTPELLRAVGVQHGFAAIEIPSVAVDGLPVSSTRIRRAIAAGDFAAAERCLGREYSVCGTVVEGRHDGQALGFPTANLSPANAQFPPDGVYAVRVILPGGIPHPAVANLGCRPTLETDGKRMLEVHIPGFSGNLYGSTLEVVFSRHLRNEKKFASRSDLIQQIQCDIQQAASLES